MTSMIRPLTISADQMENKSLTAIEKSIKKDDFKTAFTENNRKLEYYDRNSTLGDSVLINYKRQAQIAITLLDKIFKDQQEKMKLKEKLLKTQNQSKTDKKTVEVLSKKVSQLEKKNKQLQKQINRLKQIDLDKNKISG